MPYTAYIEPRPVPVVRSRKLKKKVIYIYIELHVDLLFVSGRRVVYFVKTNHQNKHCSDLPDLNIHSNIHIN